MPKFKPCDACPATSACLAVKNCIQALCAEQGGTFLGIADEADEADDDHVAQTAFLMERLADIIILVRTKFPLVTTEVAFDELLYCISFLAAGEAPQLIGPVDRAKLDECTLALVESRESESTEEKID